MPISDYVLSLALALHPAAGHSVPVSLGPDSIVQPHGGAAAVSVPNMDGAAKDPAYKTQKTGPIKPDSRQFKHNSSAKAQWIQKGQRKTAYVKGAGSKTNYKTQTTAGVK